MLVAKQRAHHLGLLHQLFPGMFPVFIHFFWNSQLDLCAEIPADFLRRVRESCNVEQVMHTYKPRSKENKKVSNSQSRSCPRFRSRSPSHCLCLQAPFQREQESIQLSISLLPALSLLLCLSLSLLINNHSLRQEYAVISVLARLDVVLQEDSLVMLFVDHNTKRAVAKCSRAGCDRGAQRLKIRGNTQSYCSLTCHHVNGVWDFLSNGEYSKFVISECSHQQLRCILLCNMMLCRHEQRALLGS